MAGNKGFAWNQIEVITNGVPQGPMIKPLLFSLWGEFRPPSQLAYAQEYTTSISLLHVPNGFAY